MRLFCTTAPALFLALFLGAVLVGTNAEAADTPVCGRTTAMDGLKAAWTAPGGGILIAAHRGGHLSAPENSLAAVDEAVAEGADVIELDVKVSHDGVPYLMHDQTVNRTTDGQGDAEVLTYAEVRRLTLRGGTTSPPTLIEALRATCGRILVDLDLKTDRIAPVVAAIQGLGMTDQVFLFDGDSDILRRGQALAPGIGVMPRVSHPDGLAAALDGLDRVAVVHGDPDSLTPALQAVLRALPVRIWINSLGDVDEALEIGQGCRALTQLLGHGADVIQTDRPRLLRDRLAQCGLERRS